MDFAPVLIRPLATDDAAVVAMLSEQLGYPISQAVVADRIAELSRKPDSGCFAAERHGVVVGWVHVYGVRLLESPCFFAEIGGLVVDATARRQGIGSALMSQAEAWAREHGYAEVRLRSGLHRTDAHAFYRSIGYELAKTSHLFRKVSAIFPELSAPSDE